MESASTPPIFFRPLGRPGNCWITNLPLGHWGCPEVGWYRSQKLISPGSTIISPYLLRIPFGNIIYMAGKPNFFQKNPALVSWVDITRPGKHTTITNRKDPPCYSWVNPLFLWPFSIANCNNLPWSHQENNGAPVSWTRRAISSFPGHPKRDFSGSPRGILGGQTPIFVGFSHLACK